MAGRRDYAFKSTKVTMVESTGLEIRSPVFSRSACSYVGQLKGSLSLFLHLSKGTFLLRVQQDEDDASQLPTHSKRSRILVAVPINWVPTHKCQQDMASIVLPQLTSPNHSALFQETTSRCALQKDVHLF